MEESKKEMSKIGAFVFRLRYISIFAIISSFIASFVVFVMGLKKVVVSIWQYLTGVQVKAELAHLKPEDILTGDIIESLDASLIGLVLLYFGYGIYSLVFLREGEAEEKGVPSWLIPRSIGQMKETLAQVIIVVLFVLFARVAFENLNNLTVEMLILPAATALLALALWLSRFTK
jgi:uncharacterized membrane protein YqhA